MVHYDAITGMCYVHCASSQLWQAGQTQTEVRRGPQKNIMSSVLEMLGWATQQANSTAQTEINWSSLAIFPYSFDQLVLRSLRRFCTRQLYTLAMSGRKSSVKEEITAKYAAQENENAPPTLIIPPEDYDRKLTSYFLSIVDQLYPVSTSCSNTGALGLGW